MVEQLTVEKKISTTHPIISDEKKGEGKFRAFLESVADAMVIVDSKGIIQIANAQVEKLFGYTAEEIIGKEVEILIPERLHEIHHKHRANYNMHPTTREMGAGLELIGTRKDKTEFPVEISLSPFQTKDEGLMVIADIRDITQRKNIENELKKSQVYGKALIDTSLDPLFLITSEGKIIEMNAAAITAIGLTREKLFNSDFSSHFIEPEKPKEIYSQALKQGFVKNFPLTIKNINGKSTDVLINASVYKDEEGKVLGVFAAARDITELKRTEELLKESEEKYRTLFDSSSDAIQLLDEKGFFDCNKATLNMFGYPSKEAFTKMHPSQVSPPVQPDGMDSLTAANLKISEAYKNGTNNFEWLHRRKNGEDFPADVLLTKFDFKGKQVLQASVRDISKRKKAEDEIRQTNKFLDLILDNIPNMIFVKDTKELRFVRFNKAGEKLLGYSSHDLIGKNDYDFFPKEQADFFTEKDHEVINKKEIFDIPEEPIDTKTGKRILHTQKITITDEKNNPIYLLGISEDITDRKKAENELKQKSEELAYANKELNSFSYSVAHDLKAPLRAINGYSKILKNTYGKQLEENGNKLLDTVIENSTKLSRLIDDILEFSKMREKEIITTDIDMNKLVKEVYDELSTNEKDRIIDFKINPLPATKGDYAMMKQVWVNLISNAYKFTKNKEKTEITIGSETKENEFIYFIKDNGAGFDLSYVNKLFQVFQRLHSAEEFEGNGIGLALVKRIIERHHGRVWAEGKVNEGATFYFSLPVRD